MQTVLITGGTGLVGTALTAQLTEMGFGVIVLSRKQRQPDAAQPAVRYMQWDVDAGTIDREALAQADYIVHLAGAGVMDRRWSPAYKKEIQESRTRSSSLLVKALTEMPNRVKAVVSASAIGIYGADTVPPVPFEETHAPAAGFLGDTCRLWEESIAPAAALGKRLVKLRIGIVLSSKGGAQAEFAKSLRFGVAGIPGSGRQVVSWIHISDMCSMIVWAIRNDSVQGTFNAVAPAPVSSSTLVLTLARQLRGKFFIPVHVPAFVLRLMLGQSSIEILKSTTVSSKKVQAAGFSFSCTTIDAALRQ